MNVPAPSFRPPLPSPEKVFAWGALTYLLVLLAAPIRVVMPLKATAMAFVGSCCLLFYIGSFLGRSGVARPPQSEIPERTLNIGWMVSVVCASLGLALKIFDRIWLRGLNLDANVMERRSLVESTGANWVSVLVSVLFPFSFLCLYLLTMARDRALPWGSGRSVITWILLSFPPLEGLLLGSRLAVLFWAYLVWLLSGWSSRVSSRWWKRPVWLLAALVILVVLSGIFADRLTHMGLDAEWSVFHSGYTLTVQPDATLLDWVQSSRISILEDAFLMLVSLSQYYLHGLFELGLIVESPPEHLSWGVCSFPIQYKFLAIALDLPPLEGALMEALPRYGIYSGLYGPFFLDFGWGALVVSGLLGWVAKLVWRRCAHGGWGWYPLYTYLMAMIFLWPVFSMTGFGSGVYVLAAFLLLPLLLRVRLFSRSALPVSPHGEAPLPPVSRA